MPGKIISAILTAKSANPLRLLDEVDKMASDFRGEMCIRDRLLDARIPRSSLNPEIARITAGKPHLYVCLLYTSRCV